MDWIERSNCDVCAINETSLTGEEYMEVSDGYTWHAENRVDKREICRCRDHN